MIYKRIVSLMQDQLRLMGEREKTHLALIDKQAKQIESLSEKIENQTESFTAQITCLTQTIGSLEKALLEKAGVVEELSGQNRGLKKIAFPSSEKRKKKPTTTAQEPIREKKTSPKDRGNNNAKRKEYFVLQTKEHDLYPDHPDFDLQKARLLKQTLSTRYEYKPPCFIKHIYRLHTFTQGENIFSAHPPLAPLQNSCFDGSFLAGMLQLRYIYSMPIERIMGYFHENGFEINKATAHGLLAKGSHLLENLYKALRLEVLQDEYLNVDESYCKVLTEQKNDKGRGVSKGYIWAALARHLDLICFFYHKGSRAGEVLTKFIPNTYKGAIQSDGYSAYKILQRDHYAQVIRIGCLQHCRRKFLDIEKDPDAARVLKPMNRIYHYEAKIKKNWKPDKKQQYRNKHIPPLIEKIRQEAERIRSKPDLLPKSTLAEAVNYTLGQLEALSNYITHPDYDPDNNAIERQMRYISISRRNSLFWASHQGANRAAIYYSLACSCRLHGINTFEYFTDILNRMTTIKPNAPIQVFQNMLPHKWKQQQT